MTKTDLNLLYDIITSYGYDNIEVCCDPCYISPRVKIETDMSRVIAGIIPGFEKNQESDKNNYVVKDVVFNGPCTIVFFEDGTKTIVKCQNEDVFDKNIGLAFALLKKIYGNKYNDIFKKYIWEKEEEAND